MNPLESSPPRTVLLIGFEPFGDHAVNSSWEACRVAARPLRAALPRASVHVECLPVDHLRAQRRLYELLAALRPEVCLCTGLAVGDGLRIERQARRPPELPHLDGPSLIEGRWPWEEMEAALAGSGCAAFTSHDAGQYVCESTYWALLALRGEGAPDSAAFLHLPPLSETFSVAVLADAVARVVAARLRGRAR